MKLVLDMNLPPRWVPALAAAGFDTAHWADVGAPSASDMEIMAWARDTGRVVVTHDLDFAAILASTQAAGPSVVQIRADDLLADGTVRRVIAGLNQLRSEIEAGALITIDTYRTRLRILPIDDR